MQMSWRLSMSKLLEARDILLTRGITQLGDLETHMGCVCALGALNIAYNGERANLTLDGELSDDVDLAYTPIDPEHERDIEKLAKVVENRIGLSRTLCSLAVYRYNDRKDTSLSDIVSLFDEANLL
jgi:hypothetical protein